jgi:hypothetical protein
VFARGLAFSADGKVLACGRLDGTIRVWDVATGTVLRDLPGHELAVSSVAFSPDGKLLASASADSTVLLWKASEVLRPAAKSALVVNDLESLWADLGEADAEKAAVALAALTAAPAEATRFLKLRLQPAAPIDPQGVARLVDDLDSGKFAAREKATFALEKLAELARPALEARLAARPTLEMRKRIEGLLRKIDGFVTEPHTLRGLRAIEVLENIGTPEARQVLERVAAGEPASRLTQEAGAALTRLKKRG